MQSRSSAVTERDGSAAKRRLNVEENSDAERILYSAYISFTTWGTPSMDSIFVIKLRVWKKRFEMGRFVSFPCVFWKSVVHAMPNSIMSEAAGLTGMKSVFNATN